MKKAKRRLSVIIPSFNEEKTIANVIKNIIKQKSVSEIIVVDDGSTDDTASVISDCICLLTEGKFKISNLKILKHDKNLGKGAAIRTGLKYVKYEYIIIQDADLEYNPREYDKLLRSAQKNIVVYGSRLKKENKKAYLITYLGNVLLTKFGNFLFGTNLTDSYSCYKLLPTRIVKSLRLSSNGFEVEAEITGKLAKLRVPIIEVPINYKPRSYKQGKKIKAQDALAGAITFLKIRLFY